MAENPATWPAAVQCINRAINDHAKDEADRIVGHTLAYTIYKALVRDGHLKETP